MMPRTTEKGIAKEMESLAKRPMRPVRVASLGAIVDRRPNGVIYVRSPQRLGEFPARVTDRLQHWAACAPERVFLAQRGRDGQWQTTTYAEALSRVRRLARGLLDHGLSPERPLMILSGNSVEHGLLSLAAMYAGIPYAPIAPAYSLAVKEFTALSYVWQNFAPAMVFVDDGARFERPLKAVLRGNTKVVHHDSAPEGIPSISLAELESNEASPAVDEVNRHTGPESIAKILYTSGSTGLPKGVITTHRMLCSNQQMLCEVLQFLADEPPVLCDWLPWNHTFGGSHNFGIALYNGGSFYIDAGKPTKELFGETLRNLREIATTAYFNVPKAYEMLVEHLRADARLRQNFFSQLKCLFFAAAGLSQHIWDALQDLAYETCGEEILVVTGLGATESSPYALSTGIEGAAAGHLGLPVPGVELKLVPVEEKIEARLRGPSITPGFWRRPELNAAAFDEENYYCLGDAVKFLDPGNPLKGFIFDGRLNEDFKLSSGTWVRVGPLRMRLLSHFGILLQDVVIAGPDREFTTALFFPVLEVCRKLCPELPDNAAPAEVFAHPEVRAVFRERLQSFAAMSTGSTTRIDRAVLLDVPPSIEVQEITDKGTINQKAVLKNRAELVEYLYREPAPAHVLTSSENHS
ncbi:MAG TPA: feruloyl-CoA synthase [Candidatus Sulfotelmatobacter sp.]|nr:feruloyl-CoA synthase [Candidatus Sulfotelmatobacter sp.]